TKLFELRLALHPLTASHCPSAKPCWRPPVRRDTQLVPRGAAARSALGHLALVEEFLVALRQLRAHLLHAEAGGHTLAALVADEATKVVLVEQAHDPTGHGVGVVLGHEVPRHGVLDGVT